MDNLGIHLLANKKMWIIDKNLSLKLTDMDLIFHLLKYNLLTLLGDNKTILVTTK